MTEFWRFVSGEIPTAYLLPTAVYGFAGTFLLIFRIRISKALFGIVPSNPQDVGSINSGSHEFLVSLMGLWFVASGVVDAVGTEQKSLLSPAFDFGEKLYEVGKPRSLVSAEAWAARAPYVAKLAIGIALFVSAGRLSDLWIRARRVGHSK